MYAYIEGIIDELTENALILDHDGIGYEILMPQSDLANLSGQTNRLRIYVYYQVSENQVALYGFLSKETKELFLMLLSVNGVGPKAAIAILGTLSGETLRFAIIGEDVKAISSAPGIGPKTAKRIILDLKDKIDIVKLTDDSQSAVVLSKDSTAKNDAMAALVSLGYSSTDAVRVFSEIDTEGKEAEELIREALKKLGNAFLS